MVAGPVGDSVDVFWIEARYSCHVGSLDDGDVGTAGDRGDEGLRNVSRD